MVTYIENEPISSKAIAALRRRGAIPFQTELLMPTFKIWQLTQHIKGKGLIQN